MKEAKKMIPTDNKQKYKSNATVSSSIPRTSALYWDIIAFKQGAASVRSQSTVIKTDKNNKNTPSERKKV